MALDVYVGSLTRYYAGNWESVSEKGGRERGPGRQGRPAGGAAQPKENERIRARVLAWRGQLGRSSPANVAGPLDWDESDDAPHFSARPGWDGFGSLVLWAAYAEHPALRRPVTLPEEWDDDPALLRSNADGFRSRFSHLVRNVELWLPNGFASTFEGEDVDNRRIVVGSAKTLARQLSDLNSVTWKVHRAEMASWGRRPPLADGALELKARYAFAVMQALTSRAVEHDLPMKLDY